MKKAAGLLAAMTMVLAACGGASDDPGGGIGQAIGVTGNWSVEVRNPDGTLDQRVEFQNAFIGESALSEILTPTRRLAGWKVNVNGSGLCAAPATTCGIRQYLPGSVPGPLTATRDAATDEVVLAGSFTVDNSGDVIGVAGLVELCDLGTTTSTCGGSFSSFSNHVFSANGEPDVPVTAGQIVQVEVRYSFG